MIASSARYALVSGLTVAVVCRGKRKFTRLVLVMQCLLNKHVVPYAKKSPPCDPRIACFSTWRLIRLSVKNVIRPRLFIRGKPLLSQCASPRALPLGLRECSRLVQNKTPVRVGGVLLHRQWIKVGLCACATSKGVGRPSAVSTGFTAYLSPQR